VRSPEFLLIFLVFVFGNFREATPSSEFRIKTQHGNKQPLLNELFAIRAAELHPTPTIAIILPAPLQLSPQSSAPNFCVTTASSKGPSFPRYPHMPTLSLCRKPRALHLPCTPSSPTWKLRYEVDKVMEEKIWGMKRVGAGNR
jgi:hypothetical protein